MKNSKSIVTIALGEKYLANWKRYAESNWRRYAEKHGFDIICIDQPLDTSARAQKRSPSWQKCLILGLDSVKDYERVVWVDCDVLINYHTAPDITQGVPLDKVGAAEEISFSQAESVTAAKFLLRAFEFWPNAVINQTARDFYSVYGLPDGCNQVLQAGIMVLSPRHHRELLEHVYYSYEEKGDGEWLMEMRPLSYIILKSKKVHWIDPRFNLLWPYLEIMYYPFLLPKPGAPARRGLLSRIQHKFKWLRRPKKPGPAHRLCLNSAFQLAFFLHMGGMNTDEMSMINDSIQSWQDLLF
jgi:hypothetical protein